VWLRTHALPDGTAVGPVAVIRSGERFAELFALGTLRSNPERTRLGTVRMGGEYLVTAESDGCTGRKAGVGCQTVMNVMLPRRGALAPVAEVPIERVAYSGKAERGALGVLEYRLSSVPEFREGSIKLVEQVRIKDDTGRDLRKAEHERVFTVDDTTGVATASEPSLWDQVVKADDVRPASGPAPGPTEPARPAENRDAQPQRRR
jgi:hypothetical protein